MGVLSASWKVLRLRSFQMFQVVYIRIAAVVRCWLADCPWRVFSHHCCIVCVAGVGNEMQSPTQLLTRDQISNANGQRTQRCGAVSGCWSHNEQTRLHGQFLCTSLSAVNFFACISNQVKNRCLPSVSLYVPLKVPSLVLANWWNLGLTFVSKWMI
jgi:hypothetical protein